MSRVTITLDASGLVRALRHAQEEIPRALRNALNDTTYDAQQAMRRRIVESFSFDSAATRSYFMRAVHWGKDHRATKDRFVSAIMIREPRPLVAPFEEGDVKTPFRGRYLALPSREILRPGFGGQVTRGTRLRDLKPFAMASGLRRVQLRGRERVADRRPQLVGQRGSFFVTLRRGKLAGMPAILQRTGRGGRRLRMLYLFVPRVKLPPILQFERTARNAIADAWPRRVGQAISFALDRLDRRGAA